MTVALHTSKRLEGWGHPRSSPAKRWAEFFGNSYLVHHRGFIDHAYRLRREDGSVVFVSEPYYLCTEGMRDLLALADDGWRVYVDGVGDHHDTTLRIRIER